MSSLEIAMSYMAFRVRRFSTVAMVMTPIISLGYLFSYILSDDKTKLHELGLAIALMIWGATFICPRILAHPNRSIKAKGAASVMFVIALFSALIWFPLNEAITKN